MNALIIVSLVWAFSFGLIRRYLASLDSASVACLRLVLSCLAFSPFLRWRSMPTHSLPRLLGIGGLQFGLMYLLYIEAFHSLRAYQVAMLTLLTPVFVSVFDAALTRRFSMYSILAALLAAIGALIVVGSHPLGHAEWRGVLLVQASNAAFAAGQLLYRRFRLAHDNLTDLQLIPWLYCGAVVVTLPLGLRGALGDVVGMSLSQWLVILYLGLGASGLGFFLWNSGAARVPAATLAVMNNVKIPLGVLVSVVVFGEAIDTARLVLGTLVIGVGFMLARRARLSRSAEPTS
jgi:drug/metabolite transporter (DMT)-like permease